MRRGLIARSRVELPDAVFDARLARPRVRIAIYTAIHDLGVHACAADVLADFIQNQDVERHGNPAHPCFRQRQ